MIRLAALILLLAIAPARADGWYRCCTGGVTYETYPVTKPQQTPQQNERDTGARPIIPYGGGPKDKSPPAPPPESK
jgi:hypothetical protein